MGFLTPEKLAFMFGLSGNIVSFLVFLAPLPTFYTIYKKKSSEGFQSIPYLVALMSAMLLLYYGLLKTNATLIVGINAFGCAIEVTYIIFYTIYAPKKEMMFTLKVLGFFNIGAFGLMMLLTISLTKGQNRATAVGWICSAFNIAVFAAPLSITRRVIRTKSVEYMPFTLSFFLTLSATLWFFYGLFEKDYFIACPNVLGFILGVAQMLLYLIYKNPQKGKRKNSRQNQDGTVNLKMNEIENRKLCGRDTQFDNNEMNMRVCDYGPIRSNENNVESASTRGDDQTNFCK